MSIVIIYPNIASQWHPTKNGDKKFEDYSSGSHYEAWWICNKKCLEGCAHEWKTSIKNRCKNNSGCPFCINFKQCIHTSIITTHPDIAKQWHPTKNIDKNPEDYHAGSAVMAYWLCTKKHIECLAVAEEIKKAEGGATLAAPAATGIGALIEYCPHEWSTTIRHRCQLNHGCPCCSRNQNTCIHTSIITTHPDIAKQWHPTKNGDKKAYNYSHGSQESVWWQCNNKCSEGCLHEWQTSIANRCSGDTGCPYYPCLNRNPLKCCIHTSIVTTHPDITDEWAEVQNMDYKPSQFTRGSGFMAYWLCPAGHKPYRASIDHRTGRGDGCPNCYLKTEGKVCKWLDSLDIKYEKRYSLDGMIYKRELYFDLYLSDYKIIIEIDGEFHFRAIEHWKSDPIFVMKKDIFKMQYADINGLRVIRIYQPDIWNNLISLDKQVLPLIIDGTHVHSYISSKIEIYNAHKELYNKNIPIVL